MAAGKDYYRVLGVGEAAGDEEIKKAYRRLAKRYHPDANPDDTAAAERFKELSEAHTVLSDPDKRKRYDAMRKFGAFGAGTGPGGRGGPGTGPGGIRFEDFNAGGGFGGLGDIFSTIFGWGRGGGGAEVEPVELSIEIPFRMAALGGKIPVTVPVTDTCPSCGGSGGAPGASVTPCGECKGRGAVSFGQGGFAVTRPCPACRGRGRVASTPCPKCTGQGEVSVNRRLMVTVPPGTDSGQRLRLKGQGQPGPRGGAPGDLVVVFQVQPDAFLRRAGLDVHCTVPINLAQALLGTKLRVRTLSGIRVVLRIPPGTQPGRKFRIKGQGIERSGRRGDQFVEVAVTIPERLTPEDERLFKDFAEKAGLSS